jgi:hypothetical protein
VFVCVIKQFDEAIAAIELAEASTEQMEDELEGEAEAEEEESEDMSQDEAEADASAEDEDDEKKEELKGDANAKNGGVGYWGAFIFFCPCRRGESI